MKKNLYTHLLFDLDRTLWDFDTNNEITLKNLFDTFDLKTFGINDFMYFRQIYLAHNKVLWENYRNQIIQKEELNFNRFYLTLLHFGIDNHAMAKEMGEVYIHTSYLQTQLIPGTTEILDYLSPHYKLHILTNGFSEVQYEKLKRCNIDKYFTKIIVSEEAGTKKPDIAFFKYALEQIGTSNKECLMIGDDLETDIIGAREAGIDQVYFNLDKRKHDQTVTFEILKLEELLKLL